MADYSEKQLRAYNSIKEKGGPIVILRNDPTPAANEWEGTDLPPLETPHFGLFVPNKETNAQECLIPGLNLDFRLTNDMRIKDQANQVWKINKAPFLAVDGATVILFTAEIERWPGN